MEYIQSSKKEIREKKRIFYRPPQKKTIAITNKRRQGRKCGKVIQIMKGGIVCQRPQSWRPERLVFPYSAPSITSV